MLTKNVEENQKGNGFSGREILDVEQNKEHRAGNTEMNLDSLPCSVGAGNVDMRGEIDGQGSGVPRVRLNRVSAGVKIHYGCL